jgi:DNA modification methylase
LRIVGDCREVLKGLPKGSVQCCVTSPPYWGLRSYGIGPDKGEIGLERTPDLYVEHLVEVFSLVREVLAKDGTLWLVLGDCYATGAGKVGKRPGGGAEGKRFSEAWKHTRPQTVDRKNPNCGIPTYQPNRMPIAGLKPKDLIGMPWRVAFALQADGWWLRSACVWHKPNAKPESTRDRPTVAHEYVFLLARSSKYLFDHNAIKEPATWRGQYRTVDAAYGRPDDHLGATFPWEGDMRHKRTVWSVNTKPFRGAHFAVYPPELIEPCILASSRPGDRILDPFAGIGTTGMCAEQLGRSFIGIELNPDYSTLARERREANHKEVTHETRPQLRPRRRQADALELGAHRGRD